MEFPLTPIESLEKHYHIAKIEGLNFVYIGNVPGHKFEHTYCPECDAIVVHRYGFNIISWNMDKQNRCINCLNPIPIIGKPNNRKINNRFHIL